MGGGGCGGGWKLKNNAWQFAFVSCASVQGVEIRQDVYTIYSNQEVMFHSRIGIDCRGSGFGF